MSHESDDLAEENSPPAAPKRSAARREKETGRRLIDDVDPREPAENTLLMEILSMTKEQAIKYRNSFARCRGYQAYCEKRKDPIKLGQCTVIPPAELDEWLKELSTHKRGKWKLEVLAFKRSSLYMEIKGQVTA